MFLISFCGFGSLWADQNDAIPRFKYYENLNKTNFESFSRDVGKTLAVYRAFVERKYAAKPKKIEKEPAVIAYNFILKQLEDLSKVVTENAVTIPDTDRFHTLERLYYGILADTTNPAKPSLLKSSGKLAINFLGGPFLLGVENVRDIDAPLSASAGEEAMKLYRRNGSGPVTSSEMRKMSALEVSRLESHNTSALSGRAPGNNFADFEKEMVRLVRLQDKKLANFDLSYARRVMYYDELKEDATSPKITAKDRYGNKWKLKWGDEIHCDLAMMRLYIDLGGRCADLKYYSGPGETILILEPPAHGKVKTYSDFASALLKSMFRFHVDRWLLPGKTLKSSSGEILGSGIVDREMAEKESIDEKYIGSYYLLFKECQLSFYNPALKRLGGTALGQAGALQSRIGRASMVFNCWIDNKDVKDDNSRIGLLYNSETKAFDKPVEFLSDLGLTLGGFVVSGAVNFFMDKMIMYLPKSIHFKMNPLFLPRAWKSCTWADARWMALKICALSRSDLEREFAESGWPTFIQRLAVEKLLSRRNELVDAFCLQEDGVKPIPCDPGFTLKNGGDTVVFRGVINPMSATVKKLQSEFHSEGLWFVIPRIFD